MLKALLFDKDGTLFDFQNTWGNWAVSVMNDLSRGDMALKQALADAADFDLATNAFRPTSAIIAGTNREAAECFATVIPNMTLPEMELYLLEKSQIAPLAPAVDLEPYLRALKADGICLGVMTNDAESGAYAHLDAVGVRHHFDFIAGFDSGFGAKPAPDPLLAFARAVDVAPHLCAMIGDSTHDLIAGERAGMKRIGVLTGMATFHDLMPYADVVLPDIGHIPNWMAENYA